MYRGFGIRSVFIVDEKQSLLARAHLVMHLLSFFEHTLWVWAHFLGRRLRSDMKLGSPSRVAFALDESIPAVFEDFSPLSAAAFPDTHYSYHHYPRHGDGDEYKKDAS